MEYGKKFRDLDWKIAAIIDATYISNTCKAEIVCESITNGPVLLQINTCSLVKCNSSNIKQWFFNENIHSKTNFIKI